MGTEELPAEEEEEDIPTVAAAAAVGVEEPARGRARGRLP